MAFGNATKGYCKKHGGSGGGGGTTDYEALLNKPSINGVELLGDKKIGTLSGDIKMTLSDISNMNLSNVANSQTLIFNALNKKWENKTPETPGLTLTAVSNNTFNKSDAKAILLIGNDNRSQNSTTLIPMELITDGSKFIVGYDEQRCAYVQFTVSDGVVTWTTGGNQFALSSIYLVN